MRGFLLGFTLLELVIVIILLGVLVSLALPRFLASVEFVRSKEAINAISAIRLSVERCYMSTTTYGTCYMNSPGNNPNNIDMEDPGLAPGAHFSYVVHAPPPQDWFTVTARRNTLDGGNTGDLIRFTYYRNGNLTTRTGTGAFSAIK